MSLLLLQNQCCHQLRRQSRLVPVARGLVTKSTSPRSSPVVVQATNNVIVGTSSSSSRLRTNNKTSTRGDKKTWLSSISSFVDDDDEGNTTTTTTATTTTTPNHDDIDWDQLMDLARRAPTPLRLVDMYKYATDIQDPQQRMLNAQFLHKELPIRIAQRAVDLLTLPYGLNEAPAIQNVAHIYLEYMNKIVKMKPPTTIDEEHAFTNLLQTFLLDRTSIPMQIAQGIETWQQQDDGATAGNNDNNESKRECGIDPTKYQGMEDALYRFFTARVGLRLMSEHHILSCPGRRSYSWVVNTDQHDELGCIQTNCNPYHEVQKVAKQVTKQMEDEYGICPKINVITTESGGGGGFTYVPHHLQYMVSELLNNSCRATVKRYLAESGKTMAGPLRTTSSSSSSSTGTVDSTSELPPVQVVVVNGAEDVSIKVADLGGGVPRSTMKHIWKFAHAAAYNKSDNDEEGGTTSTEHENDDDIILTTAEQRIRAAHDEEDSFMITTHNSMMTRAENHVRGFGLPLARIYARYFGGELTLKSMEGYGLDAYLYLPRLGDSCENLPAPVTNSPGGRDSYPTTTSSSSSSSSSSNSSYSSTTTTTSRPFSTQSIMEQQQQQQQPYQRQSYSYQDEDEYMELETRRILNHLQGRAL